MSATAMSRWTQIRIPGMTVDAFPWGGPNSASGARDLTAEGTVGPPPVRGYDRQFVHLSPAEPLAFGGGHHWSGWDPREGEQRKHRPRQLADGLVDVGGFTT